MTSSLNTNAMLLPALSHIHPQLSKPKAEQNSYIVDQKADNCCHDPAAQTLHRVGEPIVDRPDCHLLINKRLARIVTLNEAKMHGSCAELLQERCWISQVFLKPYWPKRGGTQTETCLH
jgi:hypothetical protein